MEKLDVKDKKILYELNLDSRQSFAKLGKKVGLHKDSVALRVKKLQENGIIHHFETGIDISRLGYTTYRYYFTYQFITPEKKEEIINHLVKNINTLWVTSLEGHYDLSVYMVTKDIKEYFHFWEDFFRKYGNYFSNKTFSAYCGSKHYGYSFLLDENLPERKNSEPIAEIGGQQSITIDTVDYELLKRMSANSRIPIIDLSETLKVSVQTVNNRIKNLIKAGVIKNFCIEIDFSNLEYKLYRLDINLNENIKKQPILNYLSRNPYTKEIYETIGDAADIEIEIILNDYHQIHDLIDTILLKFPNAVKDYKYHSSLIRHKSIPMPGL